MSREAEFAGVFQSLRALLLPYVPQLDCKQDQADQLWLDTHHLMKNKKPLFFAAVQVKKNYVAYHLMPVYVNPSLLKGASDLLLKRMHGKSCFNFTRLDVGLVEELKQLTEAGYLDYQEAGYVLPVSTSQNQTD